MITVTLDEYKLFASIAGDKNNLQIESLLQEASTVVENYIGLTYETNLEDQYLILNEGRAVYFVDSPELIQQVTHISRVTGTPTELDEGGDYVIAKEALHLVSRTYPEYDFLLVSYGEGAQLTPPNDVKLAVMLLTQYYYKEEYSKTSTQVGGQSAKLKDSSESNSLPNRVRTLLDFHRVL